jgi:uncharacterized protein with GYD domain
MPLYLYQAAYTAESLAAQIREPKDRIQAVQPLFDAAGAKVVASGHPFGDYDVVVVFEAPDDTAAASSALAVGAGGAIRSAKSTRLLRLSGEFRKYRGRSSSHVQRGPWLELEERIA